MTKGKYHDRLWWHSDSITACGDTVSVTARGDTVTVLQLVVTETVLQPVVTVTVLQPVMTQWQCYNLWWQWQCYILWWHSDSVTACDDTVTVLQPVVTQWQYYRLWWHNDSVTACGDTVSVTSRNVLPAVSRKITGLWNDAVLSGRRRHISEGSNFTILQKWQTCEIWFGDVSNNVYKFCGFHDVNNSTLSVPLRHCSLPACLPGTQSQDKDPNLAGHCCGHHTTKTLTVLAPHTSRVPPNTISHIVVDEYLIGPVYDAVSIDKQLMKFRRNFLLPSSRSKLSKTTLTVRIVVGRSKHWNCWPIPKVSVFHLTVISRWQSDRVLFTKVSVFHLTVISRWQSDRVLFTQTPICCVNVHCIATWRWPVVL